MLNSVTSPVVASLTAVCNARGNEFVNMVNSWGCVWVPKGGGSDR